MVQNFDQQIYRSDPIDSSVITKCFIRRRGAQYWLFNTKTSLPRVILSEVKAWRNEVEESRMRRNVLHARFFDSAVLRSE